MITVLTSLLLLTFAAVAVLVWRTRLLARANVDRVLEVEARESFALGSLHALIDASRESSDAVLKALDRSLREYDPDIDAFLAFAPTGEELRCIYSSGQRADHFRALRLHRHGCKELPAIAAGSGHRVVLGRNASALIPTDRRAIAVPIADDDGLRAVIYVSSPHAAALSAEDAIVRSIGHASAPYALAFEREIDRNDATYDGLTGLLGPRAFRTRLAEEVERARADAKRMLTLCFIDTDHFKRVNDGFGHGVGDEVLQAMAALLRAHTVPSVDIVARNGGDEFCALMMESQKSVAIERAHAFCAAVRALDFGVPIRITASVGVATFPFDASSSAELLEVADAAMYHSKHEGRDRVSFAIDNGAFAVYR